MADQGAPQTGKRKKPALDGGKISLHFRGNVNLNALGTTMVILGSFVLLMLIASGLFFGGM